MSALDPVILNEVKLTQKAIADLESSSSSRPTEYPWGVFTSSQSWTVPEDGEYFILCLGGGGGGGASTGYYAGGQSGGYGAGGGGAGPGAHGGGAGGLSLSRRSLKKGDIAVVTVGAAGNAGSTYAGSGSSGGSSSVVVAGKINTVCAGGTGGGSSEGVGGSASGGDLCIQGGGGGSYGASEGGGGGGGGVGGGIGRIGWGSTAAGYLPYGGRGGYGGGGGGGVESSTTRGKQGDGGEVPSLLSSIPIYRGPGYLARGHGGQGFVAIRRVG